MKRRREKENNRGKEKRERIDPVPSFVLHNFERVMTRRADPLTFLTASGVRYASSARPAQCVSMVVLRR